MITKTILAASIGDDIHVAGLLNFLQIAESWGFIAHFLGPAVAIDKIIGEIKEKSPDIIAVSYRLTPKVGEGLLYDFIQKIQLLNLKPTRFLLGCLPELAEKVSSWNFFEHIFIGGESIDEVLHVLKGTSGTAQSQIQYPTDLISRIAYKAPYPIIRAHFGLPSLSDTLEGIKEISDAKILDVISIAPDQAAQEWLHHPDVLIRRPVGSGGVPIRTKDDLHQIYNASRTGNYPLLRIYSGTQDLIKNAEWFQETIHNAWAAIPIFWYSELDSRSLLPLRVAIEEHLDAITWHAEHKVPVEVNDPHQWGLRMAPDHLVVAMAYLSARVAKDCGVENYIEQFMFNTPGGNSFKMDFARNLAMMEIVSELADNKFNIIRETRAGLAYFVPRDNVAKGQLVASTMMQMALKPHIVHIVSYSEATHAAQPGDIIESCQLLQRVIQDSLYGLPDLTKDPMVHKRKEELLHDARILLDRFTLLGQSMGIGCPYVSSTVLTEAVRCGLFDAPQLRNNPIAKGQIRTQMIEGKCLMVDSSNQILSEMERLNKLELELEKPIYSTTMEV